MTGHTVALVAVLGVAAYRLTRLITKDTVSDRLRMVVSRWAFDDDREVWKGGPHRKWFALWITCPFCVGVWATVGLYAWWDHVHDGRFVVVILAAAGAQAYLSSRPGA